jgi:hypothetical protein
MIPRWAWTSGGDLPEPVDRSKDLIEGPIRIAISMRSSQPAPTDTGMGTVSEAPESALILLARLLVRAFVASPVRNGVGVRRPSSRWTSKGTEPYESSSVLAKSTTKEPANGLAGVGSHGEMTTPWRPLGVSELGLKSVARAPRPHSQWPPSPEGIDLRPNLHLKMSHGDLGRGERHILKWSVANRFGSSGIAPYCGDEQIRSRHA